MIRAFPEAALPDLPALGGGAPRAPRVEAGAPGAEVLGADGELTEEEEERPPGEALEGPHALLHRQQKLRACVSQCLLKALEEAEGAPEPQQGPFRLGLVAGAASLLLANALSLHVGF